MGSSESKEVDVEYNTLKDHVREWDGNDEEKNRHIADFHESIAKRSVLTSGNTRNNSVVGYVDLGSSKIKQKQEKYGDLLDISKGSSAKPHDNSDFYDAMMPQNNAYGLIEHPDESIVEFQMSEHNVPKFDLHTDFFEQHFKDGKHKRTKSSSSSQTDSRELEDEVYQIN